MDNNFQLYFFTQFYKKLHFYFIYFIILFYFILFYFIFKDFIYLFTKDRETEAETQAEGEAGSVQGA